MFTVLALLTGCSGDPAAPAGVPAGTSSTLLLAITSRGEGEIEPCG